VIRVVVTAGVAAIAFLLLALMGASGEEEQGTEEEVKVFNADLGLAFIDINSYPQEYQTLYPLFAQKCSKCHTLARPINSSMTGDEWWAYVSRMSRKPGSGISPSNAEKIFDFLAYDSQIRARSSDSIDPELLPFLKVSEELSGVRRITAANKNVSADADTLRIRVQGDRRLNVKRFFANDDGQRILRWTQRDPSRAELLVERVDDIGGGAPSDPVENPSRGLIADAVVEALGDETDPWERVELILDWIDESVERAYMPGMGSAEETLAEGKGDATEFARLFCIMAGGAGIQTRTRVGLVAQRTSFHFHTWAEAWLDRWIPVDPYLGQFPADITHIRLASDEDDDLEAWDKGRFPGLERLRLTVLMEEDEDDQSDGGE
jgi:transglutaminase-like putative cysteine protease